MAKKTVFGLTENIAGALSYVIPVASGIVFLVCEKDNKFVRFHALQAVVWFGALSILKALVEWLPLIGGLVGWALSLVLLVSWVYLILMAYKGSTFRLPIVGDVVWEQVNK